MIITRRTALGLVPLMPSAMRALTQTAARPARLRWLTGGPISYLIEPDGRVMVWTTGPNNEKGTRLGLTDDREVRPFLAQQAPALRGAIKIAHGSASYAVMSDGRVLAWGDNWNGLLGNTPLSELEATSVPHPPAPTPTSTLSMPKVVDVVSQGKHVLALTAEGAVFAWGNGQAGQLGIGDMPIVNFKRGYPDVTAYIPYPIQVPGLTNVTAVDAGTDYSLALLKDGSVKAWGDNRFGQLGDGTVETRKRPVAVRGIANAIAIASGGSFSAALLADGTVMTWGWGSGGLGWPGFKYQSANPVPTPVPDVIGMVAIACGSQHMLALAGNGRVVAWGTENVYHPVGHPAIVATRPAAVPLITNARAVFAGALLSEALLDDGTFMVWGALPSRQFRVDGQDESGTRFPIPMVVKGL